MAADHLKLVDSAEVEQTDLSSELTKLRGLTDSLLDGATSDTTDPRDIDSIAKLVTAVTRLADFVLKSQQTVTLAEVNALTIAMGAAVDAHVVDPRARDKIKRDWLRLASEAVK